MGEAGGTATAVVRSVGRKRLAVFLLCLASFMAVVDDTIVTIALPSMQRELGFSGADAQWVLNGYVLAFGGLLLLCGRAADLWGRCRLFLAGLALFGVSARGSFAVAVGSGPRPRIAGCQRGGVRDCLALAADEHLRQGEERNRAVGIYGGMAALGFVVGMVGGG